MSKKNDNLRSAIIYQSLYLMNLLLLPGISFFLLLWLFYKNKHCQGWQRIHLYRALQLSVLVGFFLLVVPAAILLFTHQFQTSLMLIIVYFVTLHAAFVLIGMLNIARAMAKKLPLF